MVSLLIDILNEVSVANYLLIAFQNKANMPKMRPLF